MNIKLIKSEFYGFKLYHENTISIDLTTSKKVLQEDVDDNVVQHLFSSIYKQNLVSIVGINASGKTASLKYLSIIFNLFIENKTLSFAEEHFPEFFESLDEQCIMKNYFYSELDNAVIELTSILERNNGQYVFVDEILKVKKAQNNISKKNLFNFENVKPDLIRSKLKKIVKEVLREDASIFMIILNNHGISYKKNHFFDMLDFTNINMLVGNMSLIPKELIQYFDPNIERIEFLQGSTKKGADTPIKIKFYDQEEIEISNIELWKYLSSGTIKGLNLLMALEKALLSGGYVIIDEIENHLNKNIVVTILNLFKSPLNINNATLIITTHYSEILDEIERSDSIYYTIKEEGKIKIRKLSDNISRSDKKKSSVFLSGILGTAPKYSSYIEFKKYLNNQIHLEKLQIDNNEKIKSNSHTLEVIRYKELMEWEEGVKN